MPKSFFMTSYLLVRLVYGRQAQKAKLGQQKLYVGQTNRWEPLGQLPAAAGVAVRTADVPTTAASTIINAKTFLRMHISPREIGVIVAFGAPDLNDRHDGGASGPTCLPCYSTLRVGIPQISFTRRGPASSASAKAAD